MKKYFRPVNFADKVLFSDYFTRYPRIHCEYNFNTLFCWNSSYNYECAVIDNRLIIWISAVDALLMPIGESVSAENLRELSNSFRAEGYSGKYILIDRNYVANHPEIKRYFAVHSDRDLADYIYNIQDLAGLKGRQYQKKRNLINQFEKNNPGYGVKIMEENDLQMCLRLSEEWCRQMDCDQQAFEEEMTALSTAFQYYSDLTMKGINICVGKNLVAFSLFSRQNNDMYTIHFEKFDPGVKGAGQIINRESARYIAHHDPVPYINREQDLGREGLRKAKLSYNPAYIYETVQLVPKEIKT